MDALILCASAFVFSCGTYLVWPSRWNIPAHTQIGFWFVSSVVPLYVVHSLRSADQASVHEYAHVMLVGAVAYVAFMFVGAVVRARGKKLNLLERVALSGYEADDSATKRTQFAITVGLVLLAYSLFRMGFVPMFAADPVLAKYFRGEYAARYQPVATYFRLGMSLLSLLIPAAAAYALTSSKRTLWRLLTLASLLVMLVTLQRGYAVSGVVLFLGVWLVNKGRAPLFVVIAIGTYVGGTMFYALLESLGMISLGSGGAPFWSTVAASAPDLTDALGFLTRWHAAGDPLTHGHTFYGGLIPSHYAWNPAVWDLTLGNTSVDINSIGSGGLRLPTPIWGLVSFGGTFGTCVVSGISGFFNGWLARAARDGMEMASTLMSRVWVIMLYSAMATVLGGFFIANYIAAIQLLTICLILRRGLMQVRGERHMVAGPRRVGAAHPALTPDRRRRLPL